jgi:hypothetical protein
MKFAKTIAACLFASWAFVSLNAYDFDDSEPLDDEIHENDFQALRDFIKSKRAIDLEEKAAHMSITGEIAAKWKHTNEKGRKGGILGPQEMLRGGDATDYKDLPVSRNDFNIELDLYFDYESDRTWAAAQLEFDNSAGVFDNRKACTDTSQFQTLATILADGDDDVDPSGWHGSGSCEDICLKKAYFGYNFCETDDTRLDIEVGRRRLNNVFDSNIQFGSLFDGFVLEYETVLGTFSDWYLYAGGFVVDRRVNHFGWVAETGFINICDTGFDFKYSFIHWPKYGKNRCFVENPAGMKFLNSQFTAYYHLDPELIYQPVVLFAAFLVNHDNNKRLVVEKISSTEAALRRVKQNIGWYAGFRIGEVELEGDWAFEVQYQYVQAFAVGDGDLPSRAIGRGNVLDESITNRFRSNTNYKGWKFQFLYAITDNLTVDALLEWSKQIDRKIGGAHHFSRFQFETVYAF